MRAGDWITGIVGGLLVMALAMGAAFVWVFLYSMFINPGQDEAFYQAYAQQSSPVVAVVAGAVIMLLAAWVGARGRTFAQAMRVGLLMAATYIVVDVAILLAVGVGAEIVPIAAASYLTKIAGAFTGAWLGTRGRAASAASA